VVNEKNIKKTKQKEEKIHKIFILRFDSIFVMSLFRGFIIDILLIENINFLVSKN